VKEGENEMRRGDPVPTYRQCTSDSFSKWRENLRWRKKRHNIASGMMKEEETHRDTASKRVRGIGRGRVRREKGTFLRQPADSQDIISPVADLGYLDCRSGAIGGGLKNPQERGRKKEDAEKLRENAQ